MAIDWGSWEYAGGNGMRVGIEVTWTSVVNASTSATATIKIWTENQYTYSDNQTLSWGGSESPSSLADVPSGSASYTNDDGGTAQLRRTNSYTHTYSTYGSSPGTLTFTASVSGTYNGVTPSNSYSIAIPTRPAAAPDEPVLTATTASSSQINLSWTAPFSGGSNITSYKVERSTTSSTAGFAALATTDDTVRTYNNTGLTKYTTYWYRVAAVNAVGQSGWSIVKSATTSATVPGAPTGLTATPGVTSVALSWTAPTDTGGIGLDLATDYEVKRGATTLGYSGSATSFTDTGVSPATAYTYTVAAVNSIGTGATTSVSTTTIGGIVRIWNGTNWTTQTALPKVWNGSIWVTANARVWNGSTWAYGI